MSELIATLANLFTMTFVITSMFSFGLRLTIAQILEPLRNLRLVTMTLLVNFIIVPAVALLLASLFRLEADLRIGLILMSTVAGAPLVPKLAQIAKANIPFAVASTAMLVVGTVIYLPLVLPLILPGVQIDPMRIIRPLAVQILLPLGLGLIVDYISRNEADVLLPILGQISNVSLTLMLVLMLGGNLGNVFSLLGTGSIISAIILLAVAMVAGYLLGGSDTPTRRTLSLATGQRSLAAALVIASTNFADRPNVLVFLAAAGLVAMIMVMPVAGRFGKSGGEETLVEEKTALRVPSARPEALDAKARNI
jgi:BASS family bile acid:Na+ symporter